eukprot:Skav232901  [mRNA]  locus=scaffold1477:362803:377895:- [translate_table: standard]
MTLEKMQQRILAVQRPLAGELPDWSGREVATCARRSLDPALREWQNAMLLRAEAGTAATTRGGFLALDVIAALELAQYYSSSGFSCPLAGTGEDSDATVEVSRQWPTGEEIVPRCLLPEESDSGANLAPQILDFYPKVGIAGAKIWEGGTGHPVEPLLGFEPLNLQTFCPI